MGPGTGGGCHTFVGVVVVTLYNRVTSVLPG